MQAAYKCLFLGEIPPTQNDALRVFTFPFLLRISTCGKEVLQSWRWLIQGEQQGHTLQYLRQETSKSAEVLRQYQNKQLVIFLKTLGPISTSLSNLQSNHKMDLHTKQSVPMISRSPRSTRAQKGTCSLKNCCGVSEELARGIGFNAAAAQPGRIPCSIAGKPRFGSVDEAARAQSQDQRHSDMQ